MSDGYILGLATSMKEFEGLHESLDKVRDDVKYVMVEKEALRHILYDHSQFHCAITDDTDRVIEIENEPDPEAVREAERAFRKYVRSGEE